MRLAIGSVGSNLVLPIVSDIDGSGGKEKERGVASIDSIGRTVREIKGGQSKCFFSFRSLEYEILICFLSAVRKSEMDPLAQFCRWLPKKLVVLDQSLEKIEKGAPLHVSSLCSYCSTDAWV